MGRAIGRLLEPGDVVALSGELGTGKTVLAQGIVSGVGATGYVASPTFTFIREYDGSAPIAHVDLYRIEDSEQLDDLGLDDVLAGGFIVIIEWAEKAGSWLPAEHLWIGLEYGAGENDRIVQIRAVGEHYDRVEREIASSMQ